VVNDASNILIMVSIVIYARAGHIVNAQGAFLYGDFEDGEKIFMKMPQGFERNYAGEVIVDKEPAALAAKDHIGLWKNQIIFID
jgi:hypothetical protein